MAEIFGPVAVAIGLIALLVLLVFVAKRWGQSAAHADYAEQEAETQKDIRHALDTAPRDPRELAHRLRHGGEL